MKRKDKKPKTNNENEFFKLLIASVNEAVEIKKGNIKAARITTYKK